MALHWFVPVLLLCLSSPATISSSSSSSSSMNMKSKCQRRCGNVNIPYPFGIGEDPSCFRNEWFKLICNESFTPPKALLKGLRWREWNRTYEVLDISLELEQLTINSEIAWDCYSESGSKTINQSSYSFPDAYVFDDTSPYTFSNTRNKFTAIGCDTEANMAGSTNMSRSSYRTGCTSVCYELDSVINGSCTGIGCCQSTIPPGLKWYYVRLQSYQNHSDVWSFNPCSYAFLVDQDQFNFSLSNLSRKDFLKRTGEVPVVIDWVAGNETCGAARRNKANYACRSKNSSCSYYSSGGGYRCSCSPGYQGNPYEDEGCQDIDECEDEKSNNCEHICNNTPGSYYCTCRKGYHDDGRNNGTSCIADVEAFPLLKVILGSGLSLLFLLVGSTWTYWIWRKRRSIKLKEKFFQQNGGLMLKQKLSSRRGDAFKIFTIKELERATNNYNDSTIIGQGGFGVVYKGVLPNNRIVAIKKSKLVDASQIEQFINEINILSQINHRNVVKLLGCCLEDQVPILVSEFVSNGTLYHHIHDPSHMTSISLENRLRIATETSEALAYLHSAASMPIFHRDVKSANILLDNNFTAKVADFGVSRLVPIDQTQITTLVQGTWGYLDPECFRTGKLTDKSDVYSFGVILVELLTGEKAVCLNRSQEDRNLAMYFVHAMKENRLFQTLEERVRSEGSEEQLMAIAQLAVRCLKLKGDKRPTMKEVVIDLQGLRGVQDHPWVNNRESESLLCETSEGCIEDFDGGGHNATENHFLSVFDTGAQDMSLTLNR